MTATVFFDLDGVLADFVTAALAAHKKELPIPDVQWGFPTQIGFNGVDDPAFWQPFGFYFWLNLPAYPDGLCLLRHCERIVAPVNIALLSSPCDTPGCCEGKRAWVARHLPEYRKRLFLGSAKHLFAGPGKVLVDDHDANADAFVKAGGVVVQPSRPWNRYRQECDRFGGFSVPNVSAKLASAVDAIEHPVEVRG